MEQPEANCPWLFFLFGFHLFSLCLIILWTCLCDLIPYWFGISVSILSQQGDKDSPEKRKMKGLLDLGLPADNDPQVRFLFGLFL